MNEIPVTIVRVAVEQKTFDPGSVDTDIYCINSGKSDLVIAFKSESFTTIDEADGETVNHGDADHSFTLAPGAVKRIAQVEGWEWDGHVGMEISWRIADSDTIQTSSYDFKRGSGDYYIESLRVHGRMIPALAKRI